MSEKIAFLFPGQGSQYVGMGKNFHENYAIAREIFSKADEVLGFKLSRLCFEGPEEKLKLTQFTQPALLTVSYVAFKLLNFFPHFAAGHSLGEYSALTASGALKFEDALILVHKRGKYMQEAVPVGYGAMAALLGVSGERINEVLNNIEEGVVEIANWNSEEQIVIAGDKKAVERAVELIKPPRAVFLPVSAPFHCKLMEPAEEKLSIDLNKVEFGDLSFPIITNVDAKLITKGEEAKEALKRQVSRPVLWYKSMELLRDLGCTVFIEVGAGKVLSGLIKRISKKWGKEVKIMNVEDVSSLEETKEFLSSLFK
ncbi:ACP S-malonyltransferase [SCandidatus Aminicenantes bacterium Aminicenantia_JdfR_composite]|jgi:[acyl-carrier-protein] S-malonyltransferase|nr:ACP S-malonyltransferase [SCandidatus Aminicenantes bacterium Aminicenantia_JdfR_composite]MCP2597339.1 ACP S-malonyltransferase [Candidatus Aminicenantes bacterium AC-335-G13]MCP2606436.1 ACP S-malonyltransferase [Candidatus Aminicenantes bacterium AC-708-I09]